MKGAIKICGIRTAEAYECAAREGATHVGFMFVEHSPRYISPAGASSIARPRAGIVRVAVTQDAPDECLDTIQDAIRPDIWQLHGRETSERVRQLKEKFGVPVMRAITIAGASDIQRAHAFEDSADLLLLDAASGGSGEAFDWSLLTAETWRKPWFLAGGLSPDTVTKAIYQTRPGGVDVSSGVEKTRGNKDCGLIASFISRAKKAFDDIARGNAPTQT